MSYDTERRQQLKQFNSLTRKKIQDRKLTQCKAPNQIKLHLHAVIGPLRAHNQMLSVSGRKIYGPFGSPLLIKFSCHSQLPNSCHLNSSILITNKKVWRNFFSKLLFCSSLVYFEDAKRSPPVCWMQIARTLAPTRMQKKTRQ